MYEVCELQQIEKIALEQTFRMKASIDGNRCTNADEERSSYAPDISMTWCYITN